MTNVVVTPVGTTRQRWRPSWRTSRISLRMPARLRVSFGLRGKILALGLAGVVIVSAIFLLGNIDAVAEGAQATGEASANVRGSALSLLNESKTLAAEVERFLQTVRAA